jgi:hypothetical protein
LLINFPSCLAFLFNSEIETQRNYLESCRERERETREVIKAIEQREKRDQRGQREQRDQRERARKKTMMKEKEELGL